MATDRITRITVRFENADGSEVLERTYHMMPADTYCKAEHPQGAILGKVNAFGPYRYHEDTDDGHAADA